MAIIIPRDTGSHTALTGLSGHSGIFKTSVKAFKMFKLTQPTSANIPAVNKIPQLSFSTYSPFQLYFIFDSLSI
jgi:hypothetical protein